MAGKDDSGSGGNQRRRMALAAAALGLSVGLVVEGLVLSPPAQAAGGPPNNPLEQGVNQGKFNTIRQGKIVGANQGKIDQVKPGATQGKWENTIKNAAQGKVVR